MRLLTFEWWLQMAPKLLSSPMPSTTVMDAALQSMATYPAAPLYEQRLATHHGMLQLQAVPVFAVGGEIAAGAMGYILMAV